MNMGNPVYFVGAGPGDPDLITVKGQRLVTQADLILYAGSLVPRALVESAQKAASIQDTSSMTLEEIVGAMETGWRSGLKVVRLHTGDPSLYGATMEQYRMLQKRGIPYEVVPGVTAAFYCSAHLKRELTVPGLTQTVIFTRARGRTPVPERESLERLASIRASMAIYLSISKIEEVAGILSRHYGKDAPIVVGYRLSLPGEKVIMARISDITQRVREAGIGRHAVIMVGPFLEEQVWRRSHKSMLYDQGFSHGFRRAKKG